MELEHPIYVDAIWEVNGLYTNVSPIAYWDTENRNVATAYQGAIQPTGVSETIIRVKYKEQECTLHVKVIPKIKRVGFRSFSVLRSNSTISAERQRALDIAKEMVDFTWTVNVDNFHAWDGKILPKNYTVKGVIYSQTVNQVDLNGFKEALHKPDFGEYYTRTLLGTTRIMPKYGNDCSAFVSYAYGIGRITTQGFFDELKSGNGRFHKVGDYRVAKKKEIDKAAILRAYKELQPADALLSDGHIRLVKSVAAGSVEVYEQTPDSARVNTYTFEALSSGGYMPFSYYSSSGKGWKNENGKWVYYEEGNRKVIGWKKIDGFWYYFSSEGYMQTGWQRIDGFWYYFSEQGTMKTGWQKISGIYYYMHSTGIMASQEWIQGKQDRLWYYVYSDGHMAVNEWIKGKNNDEWYYVRDDGSMVANTSITINGVLYHFDSNGKCTNPNG